MVDPNAVTCYDPDDEHLEEFLLFAVCVAGKTALTIAKSLDKVLDEAHAWHNVQRFKPFEVMSKYTQEELRELLKSNGIGCYTLKASAIYDLCRLKHDLKTVTVQELERVVGIGRKTARFFILHTRRDAGCAALDTHILRYMRDLGYDCPAMTPASKRLYLTWELVFIELAQKAKLPIADFDLMIWKAYSRKDRAAKDAVLDLVRKEESEDVDD